MSTLYLRSFSVTLFALCYQRASNVGPHRQVLSRVLMAFRAMRPLVIGLSAPVIFRARYCLQVAWPHAERNKAKVIDFVTLRNRAVAVFIRPAMSVPIPYLLPLRAKIKVAIALRRSACPEPARAEFFSLRQWAKTVDLRPESLFGQLLTSHVGISSIAYCLCWRVGAQRHEAKLGCL